jgi:hypothetical protein
MLCIITKHCEGSIECYAKIKAAVLQNKQLYIIKVGTNYEIEIKYLKIRTII